MLHAKLPVLGYACKQVTRYAFQLWDMHAGYEIYILFEVCPTYRKERVI